MAKKSTSYSPNVALIRGQRDVAQSQALADMAGGAAFAQNLTGAIQQGIQEQEKRNSIRDAYLSDLGSIQNINLLDEDYNKQAVTSFVRSQRDKYAKLADAYARTKDTNLLDQMDEIKYSFSNLNTQLQTLATERKDYLNAYDKGQLVDIPELGDDKYTSMYTNKGQFNVETNGDIGFIIDGKYSKFSDTAGRWNVKNNIGETYTLSQNLNAKKVGEKGGAFYREDTKNLYTSKFKETGPEGIMVMAKTYLTGDNEYYVGEGENRRKAGNMSFESMWSQGLLAEKFYTKFKAENGSKWMYDKNNTNDLNDLMSEYYTDVTESSYEQGKSVFDLKNTKDNTEQNTGVNLNPFSKGGGSRITDADGKSIYIANTERNNRRRSVMNIVNDKPGSGTRFVGTLGDYEWDKEAGLWRSGEETYETIDLMKDERLYFAGGKFEGGLGFSATEQEEQEEDVLTPIQSLQKAFMKTEEIGKEDLVKMLPNNYSFEEKGIGPIDAVEIFDADMNSLGVYGFDFSDPKEAKRRAEAFFEKFGPDGLGVLKDNNTRSNRGNIDTSKYPTGN